MNSPPVPPTSRRRNADMKSNNNTPNEAETKEGSKKQKTSEQDPSIDSKLVQSLNQPTLYRLTGGLPQYELKAMEAEAKECEAALIEEIRILEEAIQGKSGGEIVKAEDSMHHFTSVDAILTSELTPPDRFFSVSALLGRLRGPLYPPPPPNASTTTKKLKKNTSPQHISLEKQQSLLTLDKNPIYRKKQETTVLLALWKRISSHRSAAVFRKPVNPREVPLYAEKIAFPIDLSLIRKMITVGVISSFCDLHDRIGLMCHNCVKFNGRESDYGIITREFEAYADDSIMNSVLNYDSAQKTSQSSK